MTVVMRRIGSEYSDEVTKINKKEDMMLERKLKYVVVFSFVYLEVVKVVHNTVMERSIQGQN